MSKKWLAAVSALVILNSVASAATLDFDPYVPGEGKAELAAELGLSVDEVLVDRRCVYTKTEHWMAQTTVKSMSTCTLVITPNRIILANYDSGQKLHRVDLSFEYPQLTSVALSIQEGGDVSLDLDGRKTQVQFETPQGFVSVSAWRSPPKVKPFDTRGAEDAFDFIKSKGVPVVESHGRVNVENPKSFHLLQRR